MISKTGGKNGFTRLTMIAGAFALGLGLFSGDAARANPALLETFVGNWAGNGTVRNTADSSPEAADCQVTAAMNGERLQVTGRCGGAAQGARFALNLRWSDGAQRYLGSLRGGSERGQADLSGVQRGDGLALRLVSNDGTVSDFAISRPGANRMTLRVTGTRDRAGVVFFDMPMSRQ